jgi:hypothetical protein
VAADLFIYIDDFRPTAPSEQECWQAARKAGSTLNFLGLQEDPRKNPPGSMTPGPWTGSMAYTNDGEVRVLIAKKKWDKGKVIIRDLMLRTKQSRWLDHKELERGRGFLIYLSRTYPPMTPFLLGLRQTIDGWRSYRHEDGWKMQHAGIMAAKGDDEVAEVEEDDPGQDDPHRLVKASERLEADMEVLRMLTSSEYPPPLRRIRASSIVKVVYGLGDASKAGFGWSIDFGNGVRFEFGEWCEDIQGESSNYREFRNLVNALLRAAEDEGRLKGAEIFLFRDNQEAEGAYYRSTSPSRALFDLVVTLYKLQMKYDLVLHVIWICGTHLIQQGIDGLSRGEEMGPATQGSSLVGVVPLHLGVLEKSPQVLEWIHSWAGVLQLEVLLPEGWYTNGHKQGNFIWAPLRRRRMRQLSNYVKQCTRGHSAHTFL